MAHCHGDCIEGCTLILNDLCTGGLYKLLYFVVVLVPADAILIGRTILVIINVVIGNMRQRPGNKLAVTVLTVDMGMDVLGADMEASCQFRLETAGIQDGTGSDDLTLGKTGNLMEHVGQNVHRVRHNHILGIGCVGDNGLCHIL